MKKLEKKQLTTTKAGIYPILLGISFGAGVLVGAGGTLLYRYMRCKFTCD
jgi:hypothetical protein